MAEVPEGLSRREFVRAVDWVIRERKTRKVLDGPLLAEGDNPADGSEESAFYEQVRESIEVAGHGPFHYPRGAAIPEPWRFYVLDRTAVAALRQAIFATIEKTKLPRIMDQSGVLVMATWVPEGDERKDLEHAAAAAAAVQNLLLAAEARGMGSYWSSASLLCTEEVFCCCGIPEGERLMGAIFLGRPLPDDREQAEGYSGKMRDRRTHPDRWCKWVEIDA